MKKIFFIAIAAITFTTATQAQTSDKEAQLKKEQINKMQHREDVMKDLNLTPDQQEKMKKMREDNRTKMDAIRNNASLSDEQKAEQMKTLHQEQRKNMDAILTDEQRAKMKEARKDEMMHRRDMKAGDSTMHR